MMNYKWVDDDLFMPIFNKSYKRIIEVGSIIASKISDRIQPLFVNKIETTYNRTMDYGFGCDISIENFTIDKFNIMINEFINGFSEKLKQNNITIPIDSAEEFGFYFDNIILKYGRFGFFGYISIRTEKE